MESLRKLQDHVQARLRRTSFAGGGGGGARYFSNVKRGESAELAADLNSLDRDRQKNAIKRIIANMTLGRDVSLLFVDVVKLSHTYNEETKKLVYLYLVNNARLQPDKALLAVNTFLQDAAHPSPIVRALALRSVLCLRVDCVVEYTLEPLRRAVVDPDPYVRKTAAVGIAKVFHWSPKTFWAERLDVELMKLLDDSYPIVTANAAATLSEVNTYGQRPIPLSHEAVHRLLNGLADANDWGQCQILELLATYSPHNASEATVIIERLLPRLGNSNPAVLMGAIRVIAALSMRTSSHEAAPRIESALLTLLQGTQSELVYVVLRNIPLLLIAFPTLFVDRIDAFYIRFTDTFAVKLERLRLLLRLSTPSTAAKVMKELREYCRSEVDTAFITEVALTAARVATKVPTVVPDALRLLRDVVAQHPTLLAAVVVAMKDLGRTFPTAVPMEELFEWGADTLEDDEAKVALLWLVGEIGLPDTAAPAGTSFLTHAAENVLLESPAVQLATLTAVIKTFLRTPGATEPLLLSVLETLTESSHHPDVRDRATVYERLLSRGLGVGAMAAIVHGQRPPTDVDRLPCDAMTPAEQIACINTAAAVFARPFRSFTTVYGFVHPEEDVSDDEVAGLETDTPQPAPTPPAYGQPPTSIQRSAPTQATSTQPHPSARGGAAPSPAHADPLDSLFTPKAAAPASAAAPSKAPPRAAPPPTATFVDDLFGGAEPPAPPPPAAPAQPTQAPLPQVYADDVLTVRASLILEGSSAPILSLALDNHTTRPLSELALQFNLNAMGLLPSAPLAGVLRPAQFIPPQGTCTAELPLRCAATHLRLGGGGAAREVEVAVKSSGGLARFIVAVPTAQVFAAAAPLERNTLSKMWVGMEEGSESRALLGATLAPSIAALATRGDLIPILASQGRLYIAATVSKELHVAYYGSAQHRLGFTILFEVVLYTHTPSTSYLSVKCGQTGDAIGAVMSVLHDVVAVAVAPTLPVAQRSAVAEDSTRVGGGGIDDWFA